MGSTCSTLDGVDAPRSRVSQIEQEQREKDAAALEYEIARWMEADEECRALQTDVTFDPRESSRRQSQPRGFEAYQLSHHREESGARAAQEPAQNAQGREDLPRRPGLRQRGRPRRRGAPRGDPRGPVPPAAQGGLVRRLPGYVIIFLLLGVVQAPSASTTGLLRVRERLVEIVVPTTQEQPRVRVHRGRELLGVQRQEERVRE